MLLDPELGKSFPNDEAVNDALREYLRIKKQSGVRRPTKLCVQADHVEALRCFLIRARPAAA